MRRTLLAVALLTVAACSDESASDEPASDADASTGTDSGDDIDVASDASADVATDATSDTDADADEPPRFGVPLAQGSPWPKFRANEAQTGRVDFSPADDGRDLWTFQTGKGIFSTPVVSADGTVYVGSASRSFYAIDGATGDERWHFETGEIIDSSGLLDDRGRVYFGSGDGTLYALDAASGDEVWRFSADDPAVNNALINWFEGNVAIGVDGTLYAPNDNFFVYAIDRGSGEPTFRFRMPDQTWSLPAVDIESGNLFIGNNNVVELFGGNTYGIAPDGAQLWEQSTLGSIAASPALISGGGVVVGGFDGFVRALDRADGHTLWELGALDHIYASPAVGDGVVIQPAADGTVYAIDAATGEQRWAFDWGAPIRSSPAIDADGRIYMGTGDGHLLVLNSDGSFRWAIELIADDRDDMNASPALGPHAVYIAGESGEVFGVPADYCLRANPDSRCVLEHAEPRGGAALLFTTRFGTLAEAPSEVGRSDALAFSLRVRVDGETVLALIDEGSVSVTASPAQDVDVAVSADRRFLTVLPRGGFFDAADGVVTLTIDGDYLVDPERAGLRFSGGTTGGSFDGTFAIEVDRGAAPELPFAVPTDGADQTVWELSRLAAPMPTLLPSYNQIGFDSLHFLIGLVAPIVGEPEDVTQRWLGWVVEGVPAGEGGAVIPRAGTRGVFPVVVERQGPFVTLTNEDGLALEVMSATLEFETFRMAAELGADLDAVRPITVHAATECGGIPLYGPFLRTLGLCNPDTDRLIAYGAALLTAWALALAAPAQVEGVTLEVTAGRLVATFATPSLDPTVHSVSLLLADAAGRPVALDYGPALRTTTGAGGLVAELSLPVPRDLSGELMAYVMVDTYPAISGLVTIGE
ncbi:MAG: PQQ-binding-like beta-propeller repeat protein [Myxococcales bacterium]|nr:PQQ-binding-like beta-propeller repeat protein [Myxococcales bacterium]